MRKLVLRNGDIKPEDIPPIQVIAGPDNWYFSLNNRRLWVLKRCREEGLLKDGLIRVRVREAKSAAELERYSLSNCAIEAKFMREQAPVKDVDVVEAAKHLNLRDRGEDDTIKEESPQDIEAKIDGTKATNNESFEDVTTVNYKSSIDEDKTNESGGESISEDETLRQYKNPFCLGDSSDSSDSDSDCD